MKHLLITLILLCAFTACEKEPINSGYNSKTTMFLSFNNASTMPESGFQTVVNGNTNWSFVETDCSTNAFEAGFLYLLKNGNDTICSFKISNGNIISWKNRPPHSVGLGGCSGSSLTIYN